MAPPFLSPTLSSQVAFSPKPPLLINHQFSLYNLLPPSLYIPLFYFHSPPYTSSVKVAPYSEPLYLLLRSVIPPLSVHFRPIPVADIIKRSVNVTVMGFSKGVMGKISLISTLYPNTLLNLFPPRRNNKSALHVKRFENLNRFSPFL